MDRGADDAGFQEKLRITKLENKERLARIVNRIANVDVDPASIFDVQAKRIHEYKRQLLNVLHIVHDYLRLIDDGVSPVHPRTCMFAAAGKRLRKLPVDEALLKTI